MTPDSKVTHFGSEALLGLDRRLVGLLVQSLRQGLEDLRAVLVVFVQRLGELRQLKHKKRPNFINFRTLEAHISLEQNLTIRSHNGGKEGHFCNCGDTSIHLPLTRSAQPSGQLSLYLLNEFNSL